ncbi:MAG TPA: fibronectin type III domain-containing protein [Geobacteraceae bacterium]
MNRLMKRTITAISTVALMSFGLLLGGCGGGGGVSSQVVSGVASVGATLAGQVNLKDSSKPAKVRTAVIGSDGSYAIDVTGMQAPYVIQAMGTAAGSNYTLVSYASGTGTANVNPLSNVIVTSAAGSDDSSKVYDQADSDTMEKIGSNLQTAVTTLLTKLQPLLQQYSAQNTNPITSRYIANHLGLDEMFDYVKISVSNGILTITNAQTGAVIFTASLTDIANGNFNPGSMPPPPTAPAAPTGLTAVGGSGQVTVSWSAVSNATAYNLYYATTSGVTTANGTKIANVTSPYVQSGLSAGTTYYYIVTAVNSAGESAPSPQASATTTAATPTPSVPAAPMGVMATGGTKQVTVSWQAVSGAASYNIYWATTSGVTPANGTKIAGATSPAVQIGLADSTTYYYVVTAVNTAGESAPSVQVAATTLTPAPTPTAPAAPTGLKATGGANQVSLSWTASAGATSYNLYWSTTSGVTTANGTRVAGVTSPYAQTGLAAGTTYYYIVTAVNSVGESVASAQASAATNAPLPTVPAAPTGVSATGGANQVTVSWPAVSGATSYNIYWSTATGVTTANGTKIANATSPYVQTGLTAGTTYYYVVTAVNSAGESAPSAQASAATNAPVPVVPAAPTGVTATGGTQQVTVSWSAVSGATSYNIYWSTTSGVTKTSGTKITGATSPYLQTGLADSTAYYYIVTAVNSAGESAASAQATATTAAPAIDGAALYTQYCAGCHGPLATSSKRGATATQIQTGITNNFGGMGSLSFLTSAQIQAIATALK